MKSITVSAKLQVGMVLNRIKSEGTATDRVTVTAIGRENYLALDIYRKEHKFSVSDLDYWEMDGWDVELRAEGESR